jgi:hypothetical protein
MVREGEMRKVKLGELPGVLKCPECDQRPWVLNEYGLLFFQCCSSTWLDCIEWNLRSNFENPSEPTPEEDEAFEALDKKNNPEPEWPLAGLGRNIERFGKLLQDPRSTVVDLVAAAREAGFNLRVGIQPEVEETTDD